MLSIATRLTSGTPREPLQVAADVGDVQQHPLQRRGHGNLTNRLGQLAVADHQSGDADGEVARDGIDARVHADQRLDEDAVTHSTKDLRLVDVAGRQLQRPTPRRRRSGDAAAHGAAGRSGAGPPRRDGVVDEGLQLALFDEDVSPTGQSFGVVDAGREVTGIGRIVEQREARRGDQSRPPDSRRTIDREPRPRRSGRRR